MENHGTVRITVLARDRPGELIKILEPLSTNNANIHGVFHDHDKDEENRPGSVPVEIVFTFDPNVNEQDAKQRIESIKEAMTAIDITVLNIFMEAITKKMHVIITGHIFDTDIRDSILQLNSTGARIVDIKATIMNPERESTVMFTITYDSDEILERVKEKIASLCAQKQLKYIST